MSEENESVKEVDNDYPMMLYKPGRTHKSDGVEYDCESFPDKKSVDAALKKGWFKHFTDFEKPAAKKPAA